MRSLRSSSSAVLLGVLLAVTGGAAAGAASSGTLTVASPVIGVGETLSFEYAVDPVDPQNWIGVYRDPGAGPVAQEFVGASTIWQYIPEASGTATFAAGSLEEGDYIAYALADDGYRWLAEPVTFSVVDDEPLHFATATLPLRNAAAYLPYRADVGGLVLGDDAGLRFRKVSGPSWVRVSADGAVSGRPLYRTAGTTASVVVEARNAAGETARATARIEVRNPLSELVPDPRVMSWNMWIGGTRVSDGFEKQLRFVLESDVDVIGVQESNGTAVAELGEALGWDHFQAGGDVGILSRYPIVERTSTPEESGLPAAGATVRLDRVHRTDVTVWSAHLGYTPYGPYDACFGGLPVDELLAKEAESGRTGQMTGILEAMRGDLDGSATTPVLLTGDFNAASHLDWTSETARCRYDDGVPWPTSVRAEEAGLVDTFRAVHPDPALNPGVTWSPVYKTFTGGYGYDSAAGSPEPQDRIDYILATGAWTAVRSDAVVAGEPRFEPDHVDNEWTSDHAAVITEFATD